MHSAVRAATFPAARRIVERHVGAIDGLENVPRSGAFVLAPNHTSYFDHFVAITLVELVRGVPLWILTKQESFRRAPRRVWTKAWYGIPVDRDRPGPSTVRAVQKVLSGGEGLGVYPEGTRGSEDVLLPFKAGAFRFAMRGGVPVIPMAIVGASTVLPPGSLRFRRGRVSVAIGEPIWPEPGLTKTDQAEDLASRCRAAIDDLLVRAARNARDPDDARLALAGAELVDRIIVDNLSDDAVLAREWVTRTAALTRFYLGVAPVDPHLLAQAARIRGLRAAAAGVLTRLAMAHGVRRAAERVLLLDPDEYTAHYVLGRWYLRAPRLFGGSSSTAEAHFRAAAAVAPPGDSRALVGLGDALRTQGRTVEAARSIDAAIATTATAADDPRASLRTARLRAQLISLEVDHADAGHD
ncbi:MAG: lysophospholipid acyltransferase family protein [Cellulomonas sp.]